MLIPENANSDTGEKLHFKTEILLEATEVLRAEHKETFRNVHSLLGGGSGSLWILSTVHLSAIKAVSSNPLGFDGGSR